MPSPINILLAEDDDDHYFLTEKIMKTTGVPARIHRVKDGEALMEYLMQTVGVAEKPQYARPTLIVLDINMPKKDGWEALSEIKSHPQLRPIPVIVMTTSDDDIDKRRSYALGANSFIHKPTELKQWIDTMHVFNRYWFNIVDLPNQDGGPRES